MSQHGYPAIPGILNTREKRLFGRIMRSYSPNHWVEGDSVLLSGYVKTYFRWLEAEAHVDAEGSVIQGAKSMVKNPWAMTARDSLATLATLGTKLRIVPSSRSRSENTAVGAVRAKDGMVFDPDSVQNWRDYQLKPN